MYIQDYAVALRASIDDSDETTIPLAVGEAAYLLGSLYLVVF